MKADASNFPDYFDRVLVDAPCTGLGVLRRNPDTKWKRSLQDIQRMAARQKKLLNAAANRVKPGGILVYAVCSGEPEENEQVVTAFLKNGKTMCCRRFRTVSACQWTGILTPFLTA